MNAMLRGCSCCCHEGGKHLARMNPYLCFSSPLILEMTPGQSVKERGRAHCKEAIEEKNDVDDSMTTAMIM
jgi:hypothetical protein